MAAISLQPSRSLWPLELLTCTFRCHQNSMHGESNQSSASAGGLSQQRYPRLSRRISDKKKWITLSVSLTRIKYLPGWHGARQSLKAKKEKS